MNSIDDSTHTPRWQPLNSRQRRVFGVLIEKAKTTPDAYPMTINALTNGCNQKSNRSPQMNLSTEDVEELLEQLRDLGAVVEIQGGGRVDKYRHRAYEWLGVDKTEAAVMAELLLRGEQTVGELRGRASRMEPISDLGALRPILNALIQRKLVISLTPEGRGQIVSHGLYKDRELPDLRARVGVVADAEPAPPASMTNAMADATPAAASGGSPVAKSATGHSATGHSATGHSATAPAGGISRTDFDALRADVEQLRDELAQLRDQVEKFEQLLQ